MGKNGHCLNLTASACLCFFSLRREQFTGPRVASGGRESRPSITEGVAAESSGTAAGRRGSADAGAVPGGVRSEG